MLNELVAAGCTPSMQRVFTHEWDKHFKPMANQPTYKVTLLEPGKAGFEISVMEKEQVAVLRKYEESNGFSFPGFNLPSLIPITKDNFISGYLLKTQPELKTQIEKLGEKQRGRVLESMLKKIFEQTSFTAALNAAEIVSLDDKEYRTAVLNKLDKCLRSTAQSLWNKLSNASAIAMDHNYKLLNDRVESSDPMAFFDGMRTYILTQIKCYDDWMVYSPLMFQSKEAKDTLPSVPVFLDYFDTDTEDYPVAHESTMEWINSALLSSENMHPKSDINDTVTVTLSVDAYGNDMSGADAKLPSARVPILGDVILRTMAKETPCQYRYGVSGCDSFPAGDVTRRLAKVSLETLSQPQFKGKTWGAMGDKEVLFAYPISIYVGDFPEGKHNDNKIFPVSQIRLASMLTSQDDDESVAIIEATDFATVAASVIDALKGFCRSLSDIEVNVFILKKIDKAHTKVIYYTGFSAEHLQRAAMSWTRGCANLPDSIMSYTDWGKAKGERVSKVIEPVYPRDIFRYLNKVWRLDGERSSPSSRVKSHEGIDILLSDGDRDYFENLLSYFIDNAAPYFARLGSYLVLKKIPKEKNSSDRTKNPAILGLLLYKLGCRREDYMDSQFYQFGKLLALADGLQYHYCKWVRSSDDDRKSNSVNAPVQLVGNSMLRSAQMAPLTTFATLGSRIACYMTWAKTDKDMEKGISHWFIKQINEVSKELDLSQWPSHLTALEKSELYLGYMAGYGGNKDSDKPKEENSASSEQ